MSDAQHYTVFFIPAAYQRAANVAMALLEGDNPSMAVAFSVPAVPAAGPADATATYYYGGKPSTTDWIDEVGDLSDAVTAPAGGWPVTGDGWSVTEAEAIAASAFIYMKTTSTFDGSLPSSHEAKDDALSALGLKDQMINGGGL